MIYSYQNFPTELINSWQQEVYALTVVYFLCIILHKENYINEAKRFSKKLKSIGFKFEKHGGNIKKVGIVDEKDVSCYFYTNKRLYIG